MKINDVSVYYPPAPPTSLPAAGGVLIDPTFDTPVMRVTDPSVPMGTSPQGLVIPYSAVWDAFNYDSTCMLYSDPATGVGLVDIDVANFKLSNWRRPNGGGSVVYWSRTDPDKFYAVAGTVLRVYSVKADKSTDIRDLAPLFPKGAPGGFDSRGFSNDDNRIQLVPKGADYQPINGAIAVYDIKQDKLVFYRENVPYPQKPTFSRNGVLIADCAGPNGFIHNIDTGAEEPITDNAPGSDWVGQHGDWAANYWVRTSGELYSPATNLVDPANLKTIHNLKPVGPQGTAPGLSPGQVWNQASHLSLRGRDESMFTQSYFWNGMNATGASGTNLYGTQPAVDVVDQTKNKPCPFMEEVFMLSTDPTQPQNTCRRFCHHHASPWAGYWSQPHANESQDKRLIAFVSSFGGPRTDVWIVATGLGVANPTPIPPVPVPLEFTQDEIRKLKAQAAILA